MAQVCQVEPDHKGRGLNEAKYVESADGTTIGYRVFGQGPALVLVHGAAVDRRSWSKVLPSLVERFTVYVLDRRGRRRSSAEKGPYDIAREGEDVAAVVEAAGRDVLLVGHSYGALCALEAGMVTRAVGRMVLYEPPVPTPAEPVASPELVERLHTLAARGDYDGVLRTFFDQVIEIPRERIEAMSADREVWEAFLGNAPPLMRELDGILRYDISERLSAIDVPVRFLLGEQSPSYYRPAAEALVRHLPRADLSVLPGQTHLAVEDAPELFAEAVIAFAGRPVELEK